ncbi:MAG TPA: hypothetical protein VFU21_16270 [Kofleriaceae bacterium]|nr:hypothetical protein [Kofleriaceae bacterium]
MSRAPRWIAPVVGAALLGAHAAALPLFIADAGRPSLVVEIRAPRRAAGDRLEVEATLPPGLADRTTLHLDGQESGPAEKLAQLAARPLVPALHRLEWRAAYRGGVERRVGWTQMTGPYQDPAHPPCGARILFGQRLLDDGAAGPGTIAHVIGALIDRELRGFERWPVGGYQRVKSLALDWVGPAADVPGHLRVAVDLSLSSATVGLTVRLVPRVAGGELALDARTEARVDLDNRIYQWAVDLIDGDQILSRLARREIAGALDDLLTVPPPLDLGGGRSIELAFCRDRDVEIVSGQYAAVWLEARLAPAAAVGEKNGRRGGPVLLPAEPPLAARPLAAPIGLELDGNALNGLLYVLWATGWFEQALAEAKVVESFHRDPVVADLLSVRVRGPILPLPPTVTASRQGGASYQLGIASTFWLADGDLLTPAHLFGRAGFALGARIDDVRLTLGELGLTCEPAPGRLEPCYPELAAELVARAPELHGELSTWFGRVMSELLVERDLTPPDSPARFRIERADVVPPPAGRHGPLRLELHGRIQPN